jgi:Domain of unknown function (DUF4232)
MTTHCPPSSSSRPWLVAVCLAATLTALAACAPLGTTTPSQPPTGAGPVTGSGDSTTPPPRPAPQPTRQPTSVADGVRCHTGQLRVSVVPGDNAAGHIGLRVEFVNTASHPCNMFGYPGVSFLAGPHGKQLNVPAERSAAQGAPKLIPLAVGGKAHADLLLVNTANFATATCKPVQAGGVRVIPPDETASAFAAYPVMVCSVNGVGTAQIYPVMSGTGGP